MDARHALRPGGDGRPAVTASNLLERLDLERPDFPERPNPRKRPATDSKRRANLGQFFTPIGVARFMASMLQVRELPADLRILDPGGGSGVLTAAVVAELCGRPERSRPAALHATVWEIDARLAGDLDRTFEHCRAVCTKAGVAFRGEHRRGNFVLDAAVRADDQDLLEPERHPRFHVAIMNPPYRKLRSDSAERSRLSTAGIETSNLYSAFVWLALKLLAGGGEFVAITPRSFEQALHERRAPREGLIHHSDRGVQYLSLRYTERLAQRGIAPSVGSVGDSYDNALAESIIGLYKTELIARRGPWRHCEAVELATLQWVHWYNHRRLFEPLGHVPPAASRHTTPTNQ